jgi:predicted methyltransferase
MRRHTHPTARGARLARTLLLPLLLPLVLALGACSHLAISPEIKAAVASPDRSEADRKTDANRHPEELLAFAGVRPGMTILDVGAGAGYSTELLARAVGARGKVYGQNSQEAIDRYLKTRFDDRVARYPLKNMVKAVRPDADPVPPEAVPLDMVTIFFAYHDIAAAGTDRPLLIKRFHDALKPGGVVVVADHAAKVGDGIPKPLHRIEEAVVKADFIAAGFRFAGEGGFLRSPEDTHETHSSRSPVPVDNFVLKFVKP